MNEVYAAPLILLVVIWPLLLAVALAGRTMHSAVMIMVPWAGLPAFLLAIFAPYNVTLELPWVMLGIKFSLDDNISRLFLLFTALLWWLSGLYARAYLSDRNGCNRFFVYYLLSMAGNLGLIIAQDLMSFYLFFALMSFASYGLVVHERTVEALHAGRVYIVLVVIGEFALFSAMLLTAYSTGSTEFDSIQLEFAKVGPSKLIILLAFVGFGIKAGVIGLHMWLPLAHPVAPTPASAVLSGAMIKAGLLGLLRLLPIGEVAMTQWGELFMILGLASAFYGVMVGLAQKVPKTILAYSSISQMGIMLTAIGLGLTVPDHSTEILLVITLFALHHGLCKGTLFLGVGVIQASRDTQRRLIWFALCLPALALAGAPLTSGMALKYLLKLQSVNALGAWGFWLQSLLPMSSVATTLLVGKFLAVLFQPEKSFSDHHSSSGLILPWGLLLTASIVMPWLFMPNLPKIWTQAAYIGSLWPVLLGIMIVLVVVVWKNYQTRLGDALVQRDEKLSSFHFSPQIPPGDVVVPINRTLLLLLNFSRNLTDRLLPQWRESRLNSLRQLRSQIDFWQSIGRIETHLRYWPVPLVILVLLGVTIVLLGII